MSETLALTIEVACPAQDQALLVMQWRNDPVTLASFYHREPKVWESFWPEFTRDYFKYPDLPPLFVRQGPERFAFLRFAPVANPFRPERRCCDISVNVNPAWRAKGMGTAALRAASDFLRGQGIQDVLAEIRVENRSSVSAFEKAGYVRLDQTEKFVVDTGERAPIYRYLLALTPSENSR
jgi:RimJ/RimL family protein N-acetyltransferase